MALPAELWTGAVFSVSICEFECGFLDKYPDDLVELVVGRRQVLAAFLVRHTDFCRSVHHMDTDRFNQYRLVRFGLVARRQQRTHLDSRFGNLLFSINKIRNKCLNANQIDFFGKYIVRFRKQLRNSIVFAIYRMWPPSPGSPQAAPSINPAIDRFHCKISIKTHKRIEIQGENICFFYSRDSPEFLINM